MAVPLFTSTVVFLVTSPSQTELTRIPQQAYLPFSQPELTLTNPVSYPSDSKFRCQFLKDRHQSNSNYKLGPPVSPNIHCISQVPCWSHQT